MTTTTFSVLLALKETNKSMSKTLEHSEVGHHDHDEPVFYGVVAEYDSGDKLMEAAEKAREGGYTQMDAFSPFPIHGMSEAIGFKCHKVPLSIFGAACVGAVVGLSLQYYVSVIDYPLNVGGKPLFSWPSFIPVTYECTILLASLTAVFGMLAFNGFPKPYHPVFNTPNFDRATQDKFFLVLEDGEGFDAAKAESFLKGTGADNVTSVFADEAGAWSV